MDIINQIMRRTDLGRERQISDDDYQALANNIYFEKADWDDSGIVYLPMEAGGQPFGQPLADILMDHYGINVIELPIGYNRMTRSIYTPDSEELKEANKRFNRGLNLIFDDMTGKGIGALTAYGMLLMNGILDEDIDIASFVDNVGITGKLHILKGPGYNDNNNKQDKMKELYEEGEILDKYVPEDIRDTKSGLFSRRNEGSLKKSRKFFNNLPTMSL